MPPSPYLLSPRLPRFICRSCLAKLGAPAPLHVRRISRNVTTIKGRPGAKGVTGKVAKNPDLIPGESSIRYFEETPDGDRREILDNPDEEAFLASLKTTILELEKDIGDYKPASNDFNDESLLDLPSEGPWRPPEAKGEGELAENLDAEIESMQELMKRLKGMLQKDSLSAENILKIREDVFKSEPTDRQPLSHSNTLRIARGERREEFNPDEKSLSIQPIIPVGEYPKDYFQNISLLNDSLRRASQGILDISSCKDSETSSSKYSKNGHLTRDVHRRLWKCYMLVRKALLAKPGSVPQAVWSVLWNAVSEQSATNVDRVAHVRQLGADILNAGLQLQDDQRLKYIESLLIHGEYITALEQWEAGRSYLGPGQETSSKRFWELGARIRCKVGQVELALGAAERVFEMSDDVADIRILLHVIQAALTTIADNTSVAWSLYLQLRSKLGPNITMNDYDVVTMLFLNANKPELALLVFKDLMLHGDKTGKPSAPKISASASKSSIALSDTRNEELDWEKSRALAALPAKFNNKYFFGSWIKKLIGEKELDAARKVLDLMRERGICPDARHVNGLIGAWFREGSVGSRRLAEDMAWSMIRTRLDFVRIRDTKYLFEPPLKAVRIEGKPDYKPLFLMPKATIETFSVLVQYYRQSRNQRLLIELFSTLSKARIRPDTFFLNQLIMVDSQSEQIAWAWDTYRDLVYNNEVVPDFNTFAILWAFMKNSVNPSLHRIPITGFPTPRDLFAEMMRCSSSSKAKDSFPQPLHELIIQCFGMSRDLAGTAVTLKAFQRHFGIYLTQETVRNVVLQVAHANDRGKFFSRHRRPSSKAIAGRIAEVLVVLQEMKDARIDELAQQGIMFEKMADEKKLDETLDLACQLLGHVAQSCVAVEGAASISELSKRAAEEMGVPDCVCWT